MAAASSDVVPRFDFSRGRRFQAEVLDRFCSSVHHPSSSIDGCFFMLAVFRRFTFRLTEESVSLALHSVLGGTPDGFHVHFESDRHFRFSVASKKVGLHIRSVERFTNEHFDLYCFLWRDGTPRWEKDEIVWLKEQEKEWTTVTYKRKPRQQNHRVSFARNIVQDSPPVKSKPSFQSALKVKPATQPAIKTVRIGDFYCPLPTSFSAAKKNFPDQSDIAVSSVFNRVHRDFENFQNSKEFERSMAWQRAANESSEHYGGASTEEGTHWPSIFEQDGVLLRVGHIPTSQETAQSTEPPQRDFGSPFLGNELHFLNPDRSSNAHRALAPASCNNGQGKETGSLSARELKLCFRCLSPDHFIKFCQGELRCRGCFAYGHKERDCLRKKNNQTFKWRVKSIDSRPIATAQPTKLSLAGGSSKLINELPRLSRGALSHSRSLLVSGAQLSIAKAVQHTTELTAMANFPVDPHPFLAPEMMIDPGGPGKKPRAVVNFGGDTIRANEDFVIAVDEDGEINPEDRHMFLLQIRDYIIDDLRMDVRYCRIHPIGIGMIQLGDSLQRDRLILGNLHNVDGFRVRFVRHDRARNFRPAPYARFGWIIFLAFPLDYMDLEHIDQACASFGKMVHWHNNPRSKAFVLVKCLFDDPDDVPRSTVCRQGEPQMGDGFSWTVPTFVLNSEEFLNIPVEMDAIPDDGNPHPLPQVLPGEAEQMEAWANQNLQQDPVWQAAVEMVNQQNNAWPAWNANVGQHLPLNVNPVQNQVEQQLSSDSVSDSSSATSVAHLQQSAGIQMVRQEQTENLSLLDENRRSHIPPWILPFITNQLKRLLDQAFPFESSVAWWSSPSTTSFTVTVPTSLLLSLFQGEATEPAQASSYVEHLTGPSNGWYRPGHAPNDHEAGSSRYVPSLPSAENAAPALDWMYMQDSYNWQHVLTQEFQEYPGDARMFPIPIGNRSCISGSQREVNIQPSQLLMIQATEQNKEIPRSRTKDRVYRRKRYNILKLVQNRPIQRTYFRKNRNKSKENENAMVIAGQKHITPLTEEGLRRSPRINGITEGHRNVQMPSARESMIRSISPNESLQQISELAGITSLPTDSAFIGPSKFPSNKEIEESNTSFPEISIQAIQEVAVSRCGLTPEEVTKELLLEEKTWSTPTEAQDSSAGTNEVVNG